MVGSEGNDCQLAWLVTPEAVHFLLTDNNLKKCHLEAEQLSTMSETVTALDPVARLMRYYRDTHLATALDTLICPTSVTKLSTVLPLLTQVTRSNQRLGSLTGNRWDHVAEWWTQILRCGALWCANMMEEASTLYTDIDNLPTQYQESEDPSFVALLAVQTLYREVMAGDRHKTPVLCEHASVFIEEAVRHSLQNNVTENSTIKNLLILALDWQLASRAILWESEHVGNSTRCSEVQLNGFQKDLHSLRRLAEAVPWLQNRLYLHEATLRMMAGASPNKTQQLLDKSASSAKTSGSRGLVCGRDKDVYMGEREHALALMLACKHLPPPLLSSPAETTGMLTQAARMLDALGDKRMVDQCNQLMAKLSSNCSTF